MPLTLLTSTATACFEADDTGTDIQAVLNGFLGGTPESRGGAIAPVVKSRTGLKSDVYDRSVVRRPGRALAPLSPQYHAIDDDPCSTHVPFGNLPVGPQSRYGSRQNFDISVSTSNGDSDSLYGWTRETIGVDYGTIATAIESLNVLTPPELNMVLGGTAAAMFW